jgi:hypothetical protein
MDGSRKSEKNSLLCMNIRRKGINTKEKTNVSETERKRINLHWLWKALSMTKLFDSYCKHRWEPKA